MKKIRSTVIALAMGVLVGCTEADKFDYDKNVIFVSGAEVTPVTKFVLEDTPSSFVVTASTAMVVDIMKKTVQVFLQCRMMPLFLKMEMLL